MAITLQQAKSQLQAWIEADTAVASGQMYRVGGRQLQRADAAIITQKINYWSSMVDKLSAGRSGCRVMRAVPRDL